MASPTTWNRLSYVVLCLLAVAGFLMAGFWYLPEIQRNQGLQKEKQRLEKRLKATQAYLDQLTFEVAELEGNPKAIERLARQRLGYARPGETVIYFMPRPEPVTPLPTAD